MRWAWSLSISRMAWQKRRSCIDWTLISVAIALRPDSVCTACISPSERCAERRTKNSPTAKNGSSTVTSGSPARETRAHGHPTDYYAPRHPQIQTLPYRRLRTREDRTDPRRVRRVAQCRLCRD